MDDRKIDQVGYTATMRQQRLSIAAPANVGRDSSWRDDLRLFALAWAAGFVFFLIFIA